MSDQIKHLREVLGDRLTENSPLARYSTARVGGAAEGLVSAATTSELVELVALLRQQDIQFKLIGEGSNILFSDTGYDGVIIVNNTHQIDFNLKTIPPTINVDSGVNLVTLSRKASEQGLSGFEWACGVPGSVGGAVYGNAGANGADIQSNLVAADILQPDGNIQTWDCSRFEYAYRSSILKRERDRSIILSATFQMQRLDIAAIKAKMAEFTAKRKASQPAGASLGSIFKNPAGDHAGRLIEESGLKGTRIGGAEISIKHANFIINDSHATAMDIYRLIRFIQDEVNKKFDIALETEIELFGNFNLE